MKLPLLSSLLTSLSPSLVSSLKLYASYVDTSTLCTRSYSVRLSLLDNGLVGVVCTEGGLAYTRAGEGGLVGVAWCLVGEDCLDLWGTGGFLTTVTIATVMQPLLVSPFSL